jgi:hypothetical protein
VLLLETLPEFRLGGVEEIVVDGVGVRVFDRIENVGLVSEDLISC